MSEKQRLDMLLVQRGLESSRERAKAVIMSGIVYVNNQKVDKAGFFCSPEDQVEVRGASLQYVSRGGLKIEKALNYFHYDPAGKTAIDVGASTGGFTDCLLGRGAAKVFAVDVGYGQLAWSVRTDPRVVVMERTNARYLSAEQLGEPLDFASIDVSFISLHLILPALLDCLKPQGRVAALIKPQFEAGKELVGKKGVVRDPAVHRMVIERVLEQARQMGYGVAGLDHSPIKGPEGNIEFLTLLVKGGPDTLAEGAAQDVVERAHASLK